MDADALRDSPSAAPPAASPSALASTPIAIASSTTASPSKRPLPVEHSAVPASPASAAKRSRNHSPLPTASATDPRVGSSSIAFPSSASSSSPAPHHATMSVPASPTEAMYGPTAPPPASATATGVANLATLYASDEDEYESEYEDAPEEGESAAQMAVQIDAYLTHIERVYGDERLDADEAMLQATRLLGNLDACAWQMREYPPALVVRWAKSWRRIVMDAVELAEAADPADDLRAITETILRATNFVRAVWDEGYCLDEFGAPAVPIHVQIRYCFASLALRIATAAVEYIESPRRHWDCLPEIRTGINWMHVAIMHSNVPAAALLDFVTTAVRDVHDLCLSIRRCMSSSSAKTVDDPTLAFRVQLCTSALTWLHHVWYTSHGTAARHAQFMSAWSLLLRRIAYDQPAALATSPLLAQLPPTPVLAIYAAQRSSHVSYLTHDISHRLESARMYRLAASSLASDLRYAEYSDEFTFDDVYPYGFITTADPDHTIDFYLHSSGREAYAVIDAATRHPGSVTNRTLRTAHELFAKIDALIAERPVRPNPQQQQEPPLYKGKRVIRPRQPTPPPPPSAGEGSAGAAAGATAAAAPAAHPVARRSGAPITLDYLDSSDSDADWTMDYDDDLDDLSSGYSAPITATGGRVATPAAAATASAVQAADTDDEEDEDELIDEAELDAEICDLMDADPDADVAAAVAHMARLAREQAVAEAAAAAAGDAGGDDDGKE
ncbi:hypothetical protein H9P43_002303 [Blastocladiella emersonii ATCC 22665]|nr:hypothetical protein H9P43_002303 [Blastocladiella emersonii ATCC 22665]